MSTTILDRLSALGIELPTIAVPAAAYRPFTRSGNLLFVSGHLAKRDGMPWVGQLGGDIDTETGQQAARAVGIDLLGTLHAAVGLDHVRRIVKLMCLVNSTPTFTEQHLVSNGCSEFMAAVFGAECGAHARSTFGVAQLPLGVCIEIDLMVEVE